MQEIKNLASDIEMILRTVEKFLVAWGINYILLTKEYDQDKQILISFCGMATEIV